jgi:hypothetical protein
VKGRSEGSKGSVEGSSAVGSSERSGTEGMEQREEMKMPGDGELCRKRKVRAKKGMNELLLGKESKLKTHVRQPSDHPLADSKHRPPLLIPNDAVEPTFPVARDPELCERLADIEPLLDALLLLFLRAGQDRGAKDVTVSGEDVRLPELERGREDGEGAFVEGGERLEGESSGGGPRREGGTTDEDG